MKKHHPEQANDEIYMGNQPVEENGAPVSPMQIGWNSVRMGQIAGGPFTFFRPLFVTRSEIEAAIKVSNQEAAAALQRMLDSGSADGVGDDAA